VIASISKSEADYRFAIRSCLCRPAGGAHGDPVARHPKTVVYEGQVRESGSWQELVGGEASGSVVDARRLTARRRTAVGGNPEPRRLGPPAAGHRVLVRVIALPSSRTHNTELATAVHRNQSPKLRATVENACWRAGT
jgi:hypothetical protein